MADDEAEDHAAFDRDLAAENDENQDESDDELESDSDEEDLPGGFLNLPMNNALRALFEGDDQDEDDVFFGFPDPLPAIPEEDWQHTSLPMNHTPYNLQPGPTMAEDPGNRPLNYFSIFMEDEFLERIKVWTNTNAERKRTLDPACHRCV